MLKNDTDTVAWSWSLQKLMLNLECVIQCGRVCYKHFFGTGWKYLILKAGFHLGELSLGQERTGKFPLC